jgi:hypothetical protein
MKVKELIEKLQQIDGEYDVRASVTEECFCSEYSSMYCDSIKVSSEIQLDTGDEYMKTEDDEDEVKEDIFLANEEELKGKNDEEIEEFIQKIYDDIKRNPVCILHVYP